MVAPCSGDEAVGREQPLVKPKVAPCSGDEALQANVATAAAAVAPCSGDEALATGIARPWSTRHDRLSQRYTTRVEEMLVATAW